MVEGKQNKLHRCQRWYKERNCLSYGANNRDTPDTLLSSPFSSTLPFEITQKYLFQGFRGQIKSLHAESRSRVVKHPYFVFGRSRVRISAQRLAIRLRVFVFFLNSSLQMPGLPLIRPRKITSTFFAFHYSPIILSFDAI
jgi:hypothetical protein